MKLALCLTFLSIFSAAAHAEETVDLQWSVCEKSPDRVLAKIEEEVSEPKRGKITYFDSLSGSYAQGGISFRTKSEEGEKESSVKARFAGSRPVRGAYCEWDSYASEAGYSCEVTNAPETPKDTWSGAQLKFAAKYSRANDPLEAFGPYPTLKWKWKWEGEKVHFDSVETSQGSLMEFSVKVSFADRKHTEKKFRRWIADNEIELCEVQEPKTIRLLRMMGILRR